MSKLYQIRVVFPDRPSVMSAPCEEHIVEKLLPALGGDDTNNLHFLMHRSTIRVVIPQHLLKQSLIEIYEYNEEDETDE